MLSSDHKRRLGAAAMFVLPIVLVKAGAFLFGGSGPAEVKAAPQPVARVTTVEQADQMAVQSEESLAAERHVAALQDEPFGPTPFYYEARVFTQVEDDPTQPELEPGPEFVVKAIMTTPGGNIALIEGTIYRIGQKLGQTGWRIIEIDGDTRSVTIRDPETGRKAKRRIRMPEVKTSGKLEVERLNDAARRDGGRGEDDESDRPDDADDADDTDETDES